MGFLSREQIYIAMALVTSIDLAGGVLAFKEKAWVVLLLALLFVPMDLQVLNVISKYTEADVVDPDFSIRA